MPFRLAVALAAPLLLACAASARESAPGKEPASGKAPPAAAPASKPAPKPAPASRAKEPAAPLSPGRERQATCAAEWRSLSPTEKTAKGPKWPQFYSRCVKRLKEKS